MIYEIKMPQLHRERREEASSYNVWFLMGFGCDPWAQFLFSCVGLNSLPQSRNTRTHTPSSSPAGKTFSHPSSLANSFHHRHFPTSTRQLATVVTPHNYS